MHSTVCNYTALSAINILWRVGMWFRERNVWLYWMPMYSDKPAQRGGPACHMILNSCNVRHIPDGIVAASGAFSRPRASGQ